MSNYSLGEIDALARKATRGAGYSWGMAEEAGKSVRWLSAYGFSGAEILANYLQQVANKPQEFIPSLRRESSSLAQETIVDQISFVDQIAFENIDVENKGLPLCSLYGGALINDLGHQLKNNKIISFDKMLSPLLALSQAGRVAEAYDICISYSYAGTEILCNATGIQLNDTPPLLSDITLSSSENVKRTYAELSDITLSSSESVKRTYAEQDDNVSLSSEKELGVRVGVDTNTNSLLSKETVSSQYGDVICRRIENTQKNTHFPSPQGRFISIEALTILEQFAHTTYAPATEESRLKGAG